MSTDLTVEAKEEQIEVEVEEQTTTAADAAADVRRPDQKVTKIKPGLWIENINIYENQHFLTSLNPCLSVNNVQNLRSSLS